MIDKEPAPLVEVGASKARDQNEVAGSTFGSLRRSCFKCGMYRMPAQLRTVRVLGRSERVCAPSCEALDASR
jgi:hypothetical protein